MCCVCPEALDEVVDGWDEDERRYYTGLRDRMNDGVYKHQYIELFVSSRGRRYTLADAYAFGQLASRYWAGHIMICQVGFRDPVSGPEADRDVEANRAMLARMIAPFRGTIIPGHGPDGMIYWDRPILMGRQVADDRGIPVEVPVEVPAGGIQLEVGDLHTYNGWHHLRAETGMARWPYGSPVVTILLRHDCDMWDEDE